MSKQYVPTLEVSGTRTGGHPVLTLQVIRYQKVLQSTGTCTVIWYPHSMSSLTLHVHVIRYSCNSSHPVPECSRNSSGTKCSRSSGTSINNHPVLDIVRKFGNASRGKSGTWVLSRTMSTCRKCVNNSPISHVWTSISGGMILQKLVKISNCQLAPRFPCRWYHI
jgi:hypothetical protein